MQMRPKKKLEFCPGSKTQRLARLSRLPRLTRLAKLSRLPLFTKNQLPFNGNRGNISNRNKTTLECTLIPTLNFGLYLDFEIDLKFARRLFLVLLLAFPPTITGGAGIERLPRITEHPSNFTVPRNDPVTLKCGAEGYPPPVLIWYKDGVKVQPSTHRVFLPTGSLFFLRVSQSKKENDSGVYWCEAHNRLGKVRSKNASLQIAFLRDDFRSSPTGGRVVAGERAELDCVPPKGHPPPKITWTKDGDSVVLNDRVYSDNGKLIIRETLQTDEGKYVCIAANRVGSRTSRPAILAVLVRPFFVRLPDDVIGVVGETAKLDCRAGGAPRPHVLWRRADGRMAIGRARMDEDNSLVIKNIMTEDAGVYICQAENDVATVVANATLFVRDPPQIESGPKEVSLIVNTSVFLPCKGSGAPPPLPLWTILGKPQPLGVGWRSSWATVMEDGTLKMKAAEESAGGTYTCYLISRSGGARSSVHVTVTSLANTPPPVFITRPSNQTIAEGEHGTLYCRAKGPPTPRITWNRGSAPFKIDNNRIKLTKEGDLFFEEMRQEDSGSYFCIASSASGESKASSFLHILPRKSVRHNINFINHPELPVFPPAPSRPILTRLTNTSATFAWTEGEGQQKSQKAFDERSIALDYTLEVSVAGGAWQIVASHVPSTSYTANLVAGMSHIFIVRARGSSGESPPSPWSSLIVGGTESPIMELGRSLKESKLNLTAVSTVSSRSLKITWKITDMEQEDLDGLYVHYKPTPKTFQALKLTRSSKQLQRFPKRYTAIDDDELEWESKSKDYIPWATVTVLNARASSYVLTKLQPNTGYQVFLVPFRRARSGFPSPVLYNTTFQEAPTGPPTDVEVDLINLHFAKLRWRTPSEQFIHGEITNYRILVYVNETSVFLNKTVDSSLFMYKLANLIPGHIYSITVSALSKMGIGPASQPIRLQTDPALLNPLANRHAGTEGVVGEAWFIILVGGAMFFFLLVLVILLYIRRYHNKTSKLPQLNGSVTKTSNLANFYGGENLWPDSGWHGNDEDVKSESKTFSASSRSQRELLASLAPEYAEIDTLGTFGGSKKQVANLVSPDDKSTEAYASSSILRSCGDRRNKVIENKFLSLPKGRQQQQQQQTIERQRLSQDLLNNTDSEEKQVIESKRPFFIDTSTPPIVPPTPITFSVGPRFTSTPRGSQSATLASYVTTQGSQIMQTGANPYSVNSFTSQPHLLQKGITLTLRNFAPPPPDHPPPTQSFPHSHLHHSFSRTKTMEELPYACYSATQVASPALARAASLEGRSSPYTTSSATYQSIEGLTADGFQGLPDESSLPKRSSRCNACGSRSSGSSSRKARSSRCLNPHHHHHHHGHHFYRRQQQHSQKTLEEEVQQNPNNPKPIPVACNPRTSNSSQLSNIHCCQTPVTSDFNRIPCAYTPNFYGWMSPPMSPRNLFNGPVNTFECEGVSLDGASVYGGSGPRSEAGLECGWGKEESLYSSSLKSFEDVSGHSDDSPLSKCTFEKGTEKKNNSTENPPQKGDVNPKLDVKNEIVDLLTNIEEESNIKPEDDNSSNIANDSGVAIEVPNESSNKTEVSLVEEDKQTKL